MKAKPLARRLCTGPYVVTLTLVTPDLSFSTFEVERQLWVDACDYVRVALCYGHLGSVVRSASVRFA
jgi:hypothetical protein